VTNLWKNLLMQVARAIAVTQGESERRRGELEEGV